MRIKHFLSDTKGNFTIILALCMLPMLLAVGAAIDLLRQNNANTLLQAAADSAVLAVASSRKEGDAAKAFAQEYLEANGGYDIIKTADVKVFNVETDKANGKYTVRFNGTVKTSFMALAGIPTLDVGAYSEVALGQPKPLELALVLDNTGSMGAEGRMAALKVAAHSLVDTLQSVVTNATGEESDDENETAAESAAKGNIKIGVVPFAQYVNVGVQYRNEPWVDVPDDWIEKIFIPGTEGGVEVCGNTYPNAISTDCRDVVIPPTTVTSCNDGVCTTYPTGGGTTRVCDTYIPGDPVWSCYTTVGTADQNIEIPHVWHGCVGSRDNPLDTNISQPDTPYVGFLDLSCTVPLMPLTRNFNNVSNLIDMMAPIGETYLGPGVIWGWNLLDRDAPFTQARSYEKMDDVKGLKVMVIMTDGLNTKSPTYPRHDGGDTPQADSITAAACANAKNKGIIIYSIGFKVTSASSKALLAQCATSPEMFYDSGSDESLLAAFDDIAGQLLTLRLTK